MQKMAEFKVDDTVIMVHADNLSLVARDLIGVPHQVIGVIGDCLLIDPQDKNQGWFAWRFIKATELSQLEKIIYDIP
jgi:hypothetical protein